MKNWRVSKDIRNFRNLLILEICSYWYQNTVFKVIWIKALPSAKDNKETPFQWVREDIRSDILPMGNVALHVSMKTFSSPFLSLPYSTMMSFGGKHICQPRHTKTYSAVVKFIYYSLDTWKPGKEHSNLFCQLDLPPETLVWQLCLKI